MMNKLKALHFNYAHLNKYHDALLFAMRNLRNGKKNESQDSSMAMSTFRKEVLQKNDIDIEEESIKENALNGVERGSMNGMKERQNERSNEDIESETYYSTNPDCSERLMIVEDSDESDKKIQDSVCPASEENLVYENVAVSMSENTKNVTHQSFGAFNRKSENGDGISEYAKNVEQQQPFESFNRNSGNENGIPEDSDAKKMVGNIEKFRHFFYRQKTKILPFETPSNNGIVNWMLETHTRTDSNDPVQCDIPSAGDDKETDSKSAKVERVDENVSGKQFYYENEDDDMMVDNPLSIQEEVVVETSNLENPEETYVDAKNFNESPYENAFVTETLNCENTEDNSRSQVDLDAEKVEKDPLQLNNHDEEAEQVGKLEIVEKAFDTEEQLIEATKSGEGEKENLVPVKTYENLPSEKPRENSTPSEMKPIDVIVISSDSSDEERRKNYKKLENRGIPLSVRRARNALSQTRTAVRKVIRVTRCPDKKTWIEPRKNPATIDEPNKFQPRKYFHCTSCNINLYSVSAVLHHHNQIHTPPEELLHCQMCDVKFATKTILQAHFDHHHETHLFRCNFCSCEFVLKRNLRAHMNAHIRPQVEEPGNKRLKIDEPCRKLELPIQEHLTNPTNDEHLSTVQKTETDQKILEQEREGVRVN
ncbi:uncharacterized protein [Venturia canescens]|uniref:uncharacterized protein n=1 Tax=Venturia canescens TaxID=32260 RepID=UPI001C9CC287|nr:uncharacterized protein LOC122413565 [Venturia canescens]